MLNFEYNENNELPYFARNVIYSYDICKGVDNFFSEEGLS